MAANKMMSLFSPLLRFFAGRRFNNHCLIKALRRESAKLCYVLPRRGLQGWRSRSDKPGVRPDQIEGLR
ncbi:hypothetical protein [Acidovorax sp. CCYZU-2555]|uniref:hypothetical protein n=1 Tax=Acidovorax sp. CCYZU-2555 TaxID=2835042 RepID=UPI001BCBC6A8|nr:hypothetical protein [Acidovorax sp. CCYZU-2555]MBS7777428.1 hypothetical protein [Acidovorax sp. CCYZU-2555]